LHRSDYHNLFDDWHKRELRAEYRRDRNHPSVILWSIGNEINEQGSGDAVPLVKELVGIAHDEDPTRPVTEACNHAENFNDA
jgi:beta-galactosidase